MDGHYRHTQPGYLTGWLLLLAMISCLPLFLVPATRPVGVVLFLLFALFYVLFDRLTVEVRNDVIVCTFGLGIIRTRIALSEVADVRIVKNPWYYGWGLRKIPGGWMYNVSGFDAVELVLRSGRKFRIGTDEPERLADAIRANAGITA